MKKLFYSLILTNIFCFSIMSIAGWQVMSTGTTSYLTSIFFVDSITGFAGGQNGYLSKTTNGGINWLTLNPNMPSGFVRDIRFINENTGYICGDDGNIRKTTDGGLNWQPVTTNNTSGIYGIETVDANTFFATATDGNVLKSTDGGATIGQILLTSNQLLSIGFSSHDTGYTAGQGGLVFKTTNSGQSWSPVNASTLNNFWDVCVLNNNDLYLCAYYGTLRRSNDGGSNFVPSYVNNVNFEGIQMLNSRIGYACALDGLIYKTIDGGITWHSQPSNTTESLNEISFLDSKTGYIAGTGGTILKTTDGGDDFNLAVITLSE